MTINLAKRENANPPVKFSKARNGRPSANDFKFSPKNFCHLSEFVDSVTWNTVQKKLTITLSETPKFEVMKWIDFMQNQYNEIQKSPFVDLDTNAALLTISDHCDHEIATIKLKNLKLEDHHCSLHKHIVSDCLGIDKQDFLRHNVTITYQYAETVVHAEVVQDDDEDQNFHEKDQEWQTVETP